MKGRNEPRNGDKVFDRRGITFIIAQEFFDRVKPLAVDCIATLNKFRTTDVS